MAKEDWKKAGKSIGQAFKNFGKAMGTTAKVVFTEEENSNGEGERTKTGEAWSKVGHGFKDAGINLGSAAKSTIDEVDEKEKAKEEAEAKKKEDEPVKDKEKMETDKPVETVDAVPVEEDK